ncbi:cupin domain-containing protein [Elusimicrobiota bacterium]
MARSAIKELEKLIQFPKQGIFSTVLANGETSNHTLMCMSKGSDMSEHTSTREAAVTVLKGKGVFMLGKKKIKMKPGVFIFMPRNAPHSLKAHENLAFLLSLFGK